MFASFAIFFTTHAYLFTITQTFDFEANIVSAILKLLNHHRKGNSYNFNSVKFIEERQEQSFFFLNIT